MSKQPKAQSIAERLQAARVKLALSQSEAAEKWGISKRTLQGWEQKRSRPRGLYLQAIERVLAEIEQGKK